MIARIDRHLFIMMHVQHHNQAALESLACHYIHTCEESRIDGVGGFVTGMCTPTDRDALIVEPGGAHRIDGGLLEYPLSCVFRWRDQHVIKVYAATRRGCCGECVAKFGL